MFQSLGRPRLDVVSCRRPRRYMCSLGRIYTPFIASSKVVACKKRPWSDADAQRYESRSISRCAANANAGSL